MDRNVIIALVFFAALGGVLGFLLALFDKKLKVGDDPRIGQVGALLPGANCGGCGYAGCSALAAAAVHGKAHISRCAALTEDSSAKIAAILGTETEKNEKMRAVVLCVGANSCSMKKYNYLGVADCAAAAKLHGGPQLCPSGCIGLGNCARSCRFDAISICDGVAVIDTEKCTGCGSCVSACPKGLIKLVSSDSDYCITCSTPDRGTVVREYCQSGCISCGICARSCPEGAITRDGFRPIMDHKKCANCGLCAEKCPRGIIRRIKQI